jgi:hypothetical protein
MSCFIWRIIDGFDTLLNSFHQIKQFDSTNKKNGLDHCDGMKTKRM